MFFNYPKLPIFLAADGTEGGGSAEGSTDSGDASDSTGDTDSESVGGTDNSGNTFTDAETTGEGGVESSGETSGDTSGESPSDESNVSEGEAGEQSGSDKKMPPWLAQASKQYQDREDLYDFEKIDNLIAERDRLAEKAEKIPEPPEEYEYKLNEGDDKEATEKFVEEAKEKGLTQDQFDFMMEKVNERSKFISGEIQRTLTEGYTVETASDLFQREWGKDYEKNFSDMRRGLKVMGSKFGDILNKTGLGNNPNVVRALTDLGSKFSEDMTPLSESEGGEINDEVAKLKERYPSMFQ